MQDLINQIHKSLLKNKKTIAVAESCTGGFLSNLLTKTSGSSQYFILGIVAYSNKAKESILKIPSSLIAREGAVSQSAALAMARQIRKIAGADFGIGITGIAGPKGGTAQKPVGTVFIALNSKNKKIAKKFLLQGSRFKIRRQAALKALGLLSASLKG